MDAANESLAPRPTGDRSRTGRSVDPFAADLALVVARCAESMGWLATFIATFRPRTVYVYEHCGRRLDDASSGFRFTSENAAVLHDMPLEPNHGFRIPLSSWL